MIMESQGQGESQDQNQNQSQSAIPSPTRNPLERGNFIHIAEAIGKTRQHVSRFLRGKSGASIETIRKISDATGVSVEEVFRHHEEQARKQGGEG